MKWPINSTRIVLVVRLDFFVACRLLPLREDRRECASKRERGVCLHAHTHYVGESQSCMLSNVGLLQRTSSRHHARFNARGAGCCGLAESTSKSVCRVCERTRPNPRELPTTQAGATPSTAAAPPSLPTGPTCCRSAVAASPSPSSSLLPLRSKPKSSSPDEVELLFSRSVRLRSVSR